jgi:hypothetical protein
MYFSDAKLAEMVRAADAAAEDQLRRPLHLAVPRDTEFARVFEGKLNEILKKACGGSLEAPKGN